MKKVIYVIRDVNSGEYYMRAKNAAGFVPSVKNAASFEDYRNAEDEMDTPPFGPMFRNRVVEINKLFI